MIKAIDSFNYLLKSHHRRVAVISYNIGKVLGLNSDALSELVIAAALHDIGALSVQERDMLIKEDVSNPEPHCIMGHQMLSSFAAFKDIAQIIKHHHIKYQDSLQMQEGEVPYACHIIHLADRVDIFTDQDKFILDQKDRITQKVREKTGTIFHPDIFAAFEKASKADIFWIEIGNMTMEQLFKKIDFSIDFELTIDNVLEFALTMSRIIDFRSKFTASHSYAVAHLASLIGKYFGYSDEKCKKLMIAGYLHDIGKIGIDPGLIEKHGPLTAEEFNLMKLHTYYTGQILSELNSSEWFSEIVNWAEKHHEKSDGTGYPYALDASSINEGIKIMAFSDNIAALMEERPYRKSLSVDEAFALVEDKVALHLSKDMFEVIKEHKDEINDLVQKCQAYTFKEYKLGFLHDGDATRS